MDCWPGHDEAVLAKKNKDEKKQNGTEEVVPKGQRKGLLPPNTADVLMEKYVYFFGDGKADGNGATKDVLGGKGAGLAEMTNAGLPVPSPAPPLPLRVVASTFKMRTKHPISFWPKRMRRSAKLQSLLGQKLGERKNPLLVSVRSGADQFSHARHDGHRPEPRHERRCC